MLSAFCGRRSLTAAGRATGPVVARPAARSACRRPPPDRAERSSAPAAPALPAIRRGRPAPRADRTTRSVLSGVTSGLWLSGVADAIGSVVRCSGAVRHECFRIDGRLRGAPVFQDRGPRGRAGRAARSRWGGSGTASRWSRRNTAASEAHGVRTQPSSVGASAVPSPKRGYRAATGRKRQGGADRSARAVRSRVDLRRRQGDYPDNPRRFGFLCRARSSTPFRAAKRSTFCTAMTGRPAWRLSICERAMRATSRSCEAWRRSSRSTTWPTRASSPATGWRRSGSVRN